MIGKPETFFKIIDGSNKEYNKIRTDISSFYYRKEIKKKDQFGNIRLDSNGDPEYRVLFPPKGRLKVIQKLINGRIFSGIKFPPEIHGSVKKKSCITNAKAHQGNKYFFLTDLRKYFPSIHFSIVYEQLIKQGFSPSVASIITRLVTYEGCIPQGAPTSPTLANLVFLPFDEKIIEVANKNALTYTRYIDDLTFSSKELIPNSVIQEILDIIRNSPFQYHHRKTKTNIGITEVTGVSVKNNGLNAPDSKYLKLERLEADSAKAMGLRGHIKAIKNA